MVIIYQSRNQTDFANFNLVLECNSIRDPEEAAQCSLLTVLARGNWSCIEVASWL